MKFRLLITAIAITGVLAGCSSTSSSATNEEELASTKEALEKLQIENDSLKQQLDDFKNGPDKLLAEANSHFASDDIKKLTKTYETISKKHPGSEEEKKINELVTELQTKLDKKAAEEKIATEKLAAEEKAAAEKLAAEEKARREQASSSMRKNTDEVTGTTIYKDKTSPQYINDNGFNMFFATAEGSDIPVLYVRFQYTGDNWLFIDNYTLRVDDQVYTVNPSYSEVNRDNQVGGVWEYYDTLVTGELYDIINAVINSNKTVIRSQGERYQDRTVTAQEKKALQNVLDAFKAMGGTDAQFKL
ncbi:hypothetical protein JCM10914A_55620 [Paenibacillus sp. JCM 10914]|uniref:hypothetical protein n=1 Tax=Paenibacillus sp. JCM 10914 TaxID=1236974 RepID=UPI0003CC81E3|nr:hypothetical protein [Paenibacillus sp. JCM 10914]GAE09635.1 hypothetical protein JCM10914_6006 [Paenibacillus sp. JCM 10914]